MQCFIHMNLSINDFNIYAFLYVLENVWIVYMLTYYSYKHGFDEESDSEESEYEDGVDEESSCCGCGHNDGDDEATKFRLPLSCCSGSKYASHPDLATTPCTASLPCTPKEPFNKDASVQGKCCFFAKKNIYRDFPQKKLRRVRNFCCQLQDCSCIEKFFFFFHSRIVFFLSFPKKASTHQSFEFITENAQHNRHVFNAFSCKEKIPCFKYVNFIWHLWDEGHHNAIVLQCSCLDCPMKYYSVFADKG